MKALSEEITHLISLTRLWVLEEYGFKGFYEGEFVPIKQKIDKPLIQPTPAVKREEPPTPPKASPIIAPVKQIVESVYTPPPAVKTEQTHQEKTTPIPTKWSLQPLAAAGKVDFSDIRSFYTKKSTRSEEHTSELQSQR